MNTNTKRVLGYFASMAAAILIGLILGCGVASFLVPILYISRRIFE